ncbi:hypothetical protein ACFQ7F_28995 [Streptomyces sp. NPDC056486]|uniref:hypothetical protein n=1 Tax=Streptomyces sp. NPDC056486 TaxID=3345835 RepID=UPI00369EABD1
MPANGNTVDLSTSPQARSEARYADLGGELYVANPRFLVPYTARAWITVGSNPSIDGWAVTVGDIDVVSADYSHTGNMSQSVNLNGGQVGEIQQELPTDPGHHVTVKMRAGHNNYGGCPNSDAKFWIQVNGDTSTRVMFNLGTLSKLVDRPAEQNYWHEVTYEFRTQGYDILQLHGDPDGNVCGAVITEVRAFQRAL